MKIDGPDPHTVVTDSSEKAGMSCFAHSLRMTARYPLGGLIAFLGGAGCHDAEIDWPKTSDSRGVIVMLPGVEGGAWQLGDVRAGLVKAGVTDDLVAVNWGVRPFGSLINLTDIKANRRRAISMADEIAQHSRSHPGQPIQLVGFSGGGGLAKLIVDSLPSDVMLDQVVLIAAAISPEADLTQTLTHARRGVVSFYSPQDKIMLGWGTRTMGTIDRSKSDSAGYVGFRSPNGGLRVQERLKQIPWTPAWRRLGHDGGHIGWLSKAWAAEVLAPILRAPRGSSAANEKSSGGTFVIQ